MRYAPSDRFWRNLLLTFVFTVFTLGFSVASWQGLKVSSPKRAPLAQTDRHASVAVSGAADLEIGRANFGQAGGAARLKDLDVSAGAAARASGAAITGRESSEAFATRWETGGTRDVSQRGYSASSSTRGAGGGAGGGFPGVGFGGGSSKKDQVGQKTVKSGSPSVSGKSNNKGGKDAGKSNGKKGGKSDRGKTSKESPPTGGTGATPPKGAPAGGSSPASTPEPLSMILVGTGLAGLYRARNYLR